jgi:hypothetical protein
MRANGRTPVRCTCNKVFNQNIRRTHHGNQSAKRRQRQPVERSTGLSNLKVGLGWDVRATDGAAFDLDGVVPSC